MSTRRQKRQNNLQEGSENVNETITSAVFVGNVDLSDQNVKATGLSSAKSPRIENSLLEGLRASLKNKQLLQYKAF